MTRLNKLITLFGLAFALSVAPAYAQDVAAPVVDAPAVDAAVAVDAGTEVVPVVIPEEPTEWGEVVSHLVQAFEFGKAGKWLLFSLVLIQLLMFTLKKVQAEVVKKYGTIVVVILAAAASILTTVIGGHAWTEALIVFALNGLTPFLHNLFHALNLVQHKDA